MKKISLLLVLITLICGGCKPEPSASGMQITPTVEIEQTETITPSIAVHTATPTLTRTASPYPRYTASSSPSPGPTSTPTSTPIVAMDFNSASSLSDDPFYSKNDEKFAWIGDENRYTMKWSPDGSFIAVGVNDGVLFLDTQSFQIIKKFEGPKTKYLRFSPDGRYLASEYNTQIAIWDVESGELLELLGDKVIFPSFGFVDYDEISFSQDGKRILFSSKAELINNRMNVQVWDVESEQMLANWEINRGMYEKATLSPNGKLAAFAGVSGIKILDVESGRLLKTYPECSTFVLFSPSGKKLLIGNLGKLILIDLETDNKQIFKSEVTYSSRKLLLDGQLFIECYSLSSSISSAIYIRDAETMQLLYSLSLSDFPISISLSPTGKELIVLDKENNLYIWGLEEQKILRSNLISDFVPSRIYLSQDGSYFVLFEEDHFYLMDIKNKEYLRISEPLLASSFHLSFSPSGQEFAVIYQDVGAQVWELKSGRLLQKIFIDKEAFSSQSDLLVYRNYNLPDSSVFTAWKWAESKEWIINSCDISSIFWDKCKGVISADGSLMAVSTGIMEVSLVDANRGAFLPDGHKWFGDLNYTFTPDGKYFLELEMSDWSINIYEMEDYEWITEINHGLPSEGPILRAQRFSFTSDGSRLLTYNYFAPEGDIRLWNTQTWELEAAFSSCNEFKEADFPYCSGLRDAAISGDGSLVAILKDNLVYFWHLKK